MDRRTKTKVITNLVCLGISIIALYSFLFVAEVSGGWRIFLVILGISWMLSAILNLRDIWKGAKRCK